MAWQTKAYQNKNVLDLLSDIYGLEVAGINRYLHYSFMIMGHNRIPIQKWFRSFANDCMNHAVVIGEKITSLGGHPPVVAAQTEEGNIHQVQKLLEESMKYESDALELYKNLVTQAVELRDIALEELARNFVKEETEHLDEVRKMVRKPDTP